MKLKNYLIAAMMTVAITVPAAVSAEIVDRPNTRQLRLLGRENKGFKRMPSRVVIEYVYTGTGIELLPTDVYSEFDVTVTCTETGEVFSGYLSEGYGYCLETGPLSGNVEIHCATPEGTEFGGIMDL